MITKNDRIALFFPSFDIGGVERVLITLANEFERKGLKPIVIVSQDKGHLRNTLLDSIQVIDLKCRIRKSILRLRKYLKNEKIDSLISGPNFPNYISILASIGTNTKVVVTQHCYFDTETKKMGLLQYLIPLGIRYCYNHAYRVVAISQGIRQYLIDMGVSSDKIQLIYNPIDVDSILYSADEVLELPTQGKYILFVGRLSPVKNLPFLIKAFKQLRVSHPEYSLVICGDGPEMANMRKVVQNESLNEHVHFMGAVSNPYSYIKNASCLVLPSFSEALPTILIESMVCGITCVTTPNKGSVEILDNGNYGYISSDYENISDFNNQILKALEKPFDVNVLMSRVGMFEKQYIVNKYLKMFNND